MRSTTLGIRLSGQAPQRALGQSHRVGLVVGSVLFALLVLAGVAPSVQATDVAFVDTDVLNLRSGSGTWADVITRMWQNEAVEVLDGPTEDGWYKVNYAGEIGWTYGGYLSIDGAPGWEPWPEETAVGGGDSEPEHWIDIDRTSRTVSLMVGTEAAATYPASLGWDTSADGFYATAIGTYFVYGMNADLTWTDWGQAYIQDWVAFDPDRSNGFHAWSMDANGRVIPSGDGPTGGCVALEPWAANELYAFASLGMRVEVHW